MGVGILQFFIFLYDVETRLYSIFGMYAKAMGWDVVMRTSVVSSRSECLVWRMLHDVVSRLYQCCFDDCGYWGNRRSNRMKNVLFEGVFWVFWGEGREGFRGVFMVVFRLEHVRDDKIFVETDVFVYGFGCVFESLIWLQKRGQVIGLQGFWCGCMVVMVWLIRTWFKVVFGREWWYFAGVCEWSTLGDL